MDGGEDVARPITSFLMRWKSVIFYKVATTAIRKARRQVKSRNVCYMSQKLSWLRSIVQYSAKRWRLGCVIPLPGSLGRGGEFTQPSLHLLIEYLQSMVETFLLSFGNGWLKYYAIVQFGGGQRNILRGILHRHCHVVWRRLAHVWIRGHASKYDIWKSCCKKFQIG